MNQRERFEAACRRAYPNMHPIILDHSALGYRESWVDKMWQGFQAGEASGLELAAKVCDERAARNEAAQLHFFRSESIYCAEAIRAELQRRQQPAGEAASVPATGIRALLTQDGARERESYESR